MKKDCGNHDYCDGESLVKIILSAIAVLVGVVILIIFIVWLVLRPTKPQFYLQDVSVRSLSVNSTPPAISGAGALLDAVIQVTVVSRNPNARIGVYYDRVDVYATYKFQQITVASSLLPAYQGHKDVDVWSPVLAGYAVPVASYVSSALQEECAAGLVLIDVKMDGRLRWKVGTWISGHYHLFVSCPAMLTTQSGDGAGKAMRFGQAVQCHVEV